jgi:hypothetical protein
LSWVVSNVRKVSRFCARVALEFFEPEDAPAVVGEFPAVDE